MTVISVTGLVKVYRSFRMMVRALDGVDLNIGEGEAFGLLGPNGAGKTTLVKCVLGLVHATKGTIRVNGRGPEDPEARREVGFAPEFPLFSEFLSAHEVLRIHGRLAGLTDAQVAVEAEDLLSEAPLVGAPKRVKAWSKGMLRRLALAQAMLGRPRLLVLDEPTADLDPIGRREVRNQLLAAKERGVTILLNSHLLSEVERICDRVAIIHRGGVLATGTVAELVPEGKDLEDVFVDLVERAGR